MKLVLDSFRCSFSSARSALVGVTLTVNVSANYTALIMAFFGITYLGYQNPIGDRMLPSAQNKLDSRGMAALVQLQCRRCASLAHLFNLHLLVRSSMFGFSLRTHQTCISRYQDMIRRVRGCNFILNTYNYVLSACITNQREVLYRLVVHAILLSQNREINN